MPRLTRNQRHQPGQLQAGQTARQVANAFQVLLRTTYRLQQRYQTTNTTDDRPRSGRPRVTYRRQDRQVVRQEIALSLLRKLLNRPMGTPSDTLVQTPCVDDWRADTSTVTGHTEVPFQHHVIAKIGFSWQHSTSIGTTSSGEESSSQTRAVTVSQQQKAERGRERVWRLRGKRYADACVVERDSWGGPSIIVWGGIGLAKRVGSVVFQNIGPGKGNGVTAAWYIDQVLRPHAIPHLARRRNNTFQHDSACAHTATAIRDFLQQKGIRALKWPALSPDLNPIVHPWDEIQRRLKDVGARPTTAAELRQAFLSVGSSAYSLHQPPHPFRVSTLHGSHQCAWRTHCDAIFSETSVVFHFENI
ncbi:uncharacterized protein [Haliotis cracherodii]|uniref:uncharacterized protein n=1 Tax=Haliotis cracherodii TaxID=6455 RepID=UPI0039E96737